MAHAAAASLALLPPAVDPAVLRLLRGADRSRRSALQTFLPTALNAGIRRAARDRDLGGDAYLLGWHRRHRRGRLPRRAVRAPRPRRGGRSRPRCRDASLVVAAAGPPIGALLPLFARTGFAHRRTGPSRDLIVRHATPQGASGRVYGFVYSGLDLGATVWPGDDSAAMLDRGAAARDLHADRGAARARDRHVSTCGAAGHRRRQPEGATWISASRDGARWCARRARDWGAAAPRRWRRGRATVTIARAPGPTSSARPRRRSAPRAGSAWPGSPATSPRRRAAPRRSPRARSPTSWSTTPAGRRPAISATGTATPGSARSTPTC